MFDVFEEEAKLKALAKKWLGVTTALAADLNSNGVKAAEAYFPAGAPIVAGAETLLNVGIEGCQALIKIGDGAGVQGRLKRLADDLTTLENANDKHSFGWISRLVQTVWDDLFGGNTTVSAVNTGTAATPVAQAAKG